MVFASMPVASGQHSVTGTVASRPTVFLRGRSSTGDSVEKIHFSQKDATSTITQLGRQTQWRQILQLLDYMREKQIQPDVVTCSAAISAFSKAHRWELGCATLQETPADSYAYTAAIGAASKGQQHHIVGELVREMQQNGLTPTVITYNIAIGAFTKGNQWDRALMLFDDMAESSVQPDIVTYNTAINAAEKGRQWDLALALLSGMTEAGLQPDLITRNSVLSAFAKALRWEWILELLDVMKRQALDPDVITHNIAISAMDNVGQWDFTLMLLEDARATGVRPEAIIFNMGLSASRKAKRWKQCLALRQQMQESNIQPDSIAYSDIIATVGDAQQWEHCLSVFWSASEERIVMNDQSHRAVLSAFIKSSQMHDTVYLVQQMSEGLLDQRARITNAAIALLAEADQWDLSLQLLREVEEPDVVRLNVAMKAFGDSSRWEVALHVLHDALPANIEPDVVTYNIALTALERAEQWEQVLSVFSNMKQEAETNVISYSVAMRALEKGQQATKALDLWQEMHTFAVDPDMIAYNTVICVLASSEDWEQALSLLYEMQAQDMQPDVIAYNAAMSAFTKASERGQQWEQALHLLQDMMEKRMRMSVVTGSSAISAFAKGQQWERSLALLHEMVVCGMEPTLITYNAAISACEKGREWDRVLALLSDMASRRMEPSAITYNAVINAAGKGQQWQLALSMLRNMYATRMEVGLITYNAAIAAAERAPKWEMALDLLHELSVCELQPDMVSFNSALTVCSSSQHWEQALGLLDRMAAEGMLDEMMDDGVEPYMGSVRTLLMECEQRGLIHHEVGVIQCLEGAGASHAAGAGGLGAAVANAVAVRHICAGNPAHARVALQEAAARGNWNSASPSLWHSCDGSTNSRFMPALQTSTKISASAPYAKELTLLHHVLSEAEAGNAKSVCEAVERFGTKKNQGWLKVAGGAKTEVLTQTVRGAAPSRMILEIGTYIGYSSTRMTTSVPGVPIATVEVDPVHVVIARNVLVHAGCWNIVNVWTGHSRDVLPRLAARLRSEGRAVGAVFMDQIGSRFHTDADVLEDHGVLLKGSVIVADNVLKPGAPLFLWSVTQSGAYNTQIQRVREFAMPAEDWISVSVLCNPAASVPAPPSDVLCLHDEADRIREKARNPGRSVSFAEWRAFSDQMRKRLALAGIVATSELYE